MNVTHGNGLTFNLGERVQTFTHPLWLALLTAGYLVVGNVYYATFAPVDRRVAVGVLAGGVAGADAVAGLGGRGGAALVAGVHRLLDVGAREPARQPAAGGVRGRLPARERIAGAAG